MESDVPNQPACTTEGLPKTYHVKASFGFPAINPGYKLPGDLAQLGER